ncbi:MAG: ParB N-terminal domain-containing protein [Thermoplasmata archaeon]|nr:ParB N-terminal domain-containing protein [Thermoplasmata archaeon]MCI4358915.1 ParB N-terminal domain-containing protein [Thermoplasmata archaeon]
MKPPEFALLPLSELKEHEQVDPITVRALVEQIRSDGLVRDPIWVARGTGVILNGHHRYHALVALGARRAPAWVFDYDDPSVELERWSPGPPVSKELVVERARTGVPFPPKTTKHVLRVRLPNRATPLSDLLPPESMAQRVEPRPSRTAGRSDGAR